MTKIIGHRGSAGTSPENTMKSFEEAEKAGADGIELDVQMTKDGVLVVIHDEKVDRTTKGKGWVKDFTFQSIRKLDASYKFSEKGSFSQIPSLTEVFKWAKTNSMLLNVELKNGLIDYKDLEEKVINMVYSHHLEQRVILSSFNHYSIVKCHEIAPEIETAVLFMEGLYEPWAYARQLGAKAIHPYHPVAKAKIIKQSQAEGIAVRPFTVNEQKMMKQLINEQTDAFITDYPGKAVSLMNET